MTDDKVPLKKQIIQTRVDNPIVVKAEKTVTRKEKFNKWFKKNQATIYLTIAGLSSLISGYYQYKKGYVKARANYDKMANETGREVAQSQEKMYALSNKQTDAIVQASKDIQTSAAGVKVNAARLKAMEGIINSPDFKAYLKTKHGISNLRKVKGVKK